MLETLSPRTAIRHYDHTHLSVTELDVCQDQYDYDQQDTDPDVEYELFLENAGRDEARLQEDVEAQMGIF